MSDVYPVAAVAVSHRRAAARAGPAALQRGRPFAQHRSAPMTERSTLVVSCAVSRQQ